MVDLPKRTIRELLALHVGIAEQLRARDVTRTSNNLTGDFAEHLFCEAFQWERQPNSCPSVDAIDPETKSKYQIKSRRLTNGNGPHEFGAIRKLNDNLFDVLAVVLFEPDYSVKRAVLIPHALLLEGKHVRHSSHVNADKFFLTEQLCKDPRVEDVTEKLRGVRFA